jgi:hypothetical protein
LWKRLKGLEPSTFCMAIGLASAVTCMFYLQIEWISGVITPSERIRIPANQADSERVPGTNQERSDRDARGSGASPVQPEVEGCLSTTVHGDTVSGRSAARTRNPELFAHCRYCEAAPSGQTARAV